MFAAQSVYLHVNSTHIMTRLYASSENRPSDLDRMKLVRRYMKDIRKMNAVNMLKIINSKSLSYISLCY
jgi:hypothetical protein